MKQVSVGIIGCGNISKAHINSLSKIPQAKLTAFCDIQRERAEERAKPFSGAVYTDYKEMLDSERLDAAYILTPPTMRADQETLAASKGINLFIEKPLALNLEEPLKKQKLLKESKVIVSVGYIIRYVGAVKKIKRFLKDRKVTLAFASYLCPLPSMPWWTKMELSAGQIMDQTIHLLDLFRYLVGDVASVYASFGYEAFKGRENTDISDSGAVTLTFKNGAVGSAINTCCLKAPGPSKGIWLSGEDFFIDFSYNNLKISTPDETIEEPVNLGEGYFNESEAFIKSVAAGRPRGILSPYSEGIKTLALILAINESAKKGKPVKVKSRPRA